jgi:hypothetical protein
VHNDQAESNYLSGLKTATEIDLRGVEFSADLLAKVIDGLPIQDGRPVLGNARFDRAKFNEDARFNEMLFIGTSSFHDAEFVGTACLDGADFMGDVRFFAKYRGVVSFRKAHFGELRFLSLMRGAPKFILDGAEFEKLMRIQVSGPYLSCQDAKFNAGAIMHMLGTHVVLDGTSFGAPSVLAPRDPAIVGLRISDPEHVRKIPLFNKVFQARVLEERPKPISLRNVDVSNLSLEEVNLKACLFAGAHHLDQLRIEGTSAFADTPSGVYRGFALPPVWWWTRRQTLAEEQRWRATHPRKHVGWYNDDCQTSPWLVESISISPPARLAILYRALRKANEDSKNEPGAADFYYGEMEMRRLDNANSWSERIILTLYWLVSGYGLRALRALTLLALALVGSSLAFQHIGFAAMHTSLRTSFIYAAQTAISIPDVQTQLTDWGRLIRIALRLITPLLLGLSLLAVRNRVKR